MLQLDSFTSEMLAGFIDRNRHHDFIRLKREFAPAPTTSRTKGGRERRPRATLKNWGADIWLWEPPDERRAEVEIARAERTDDAEEEQDGSLMERVKKVTRRAPAVNHDPKTWTKVPTGQLVQSLASSLAPDCGWMVEAWTGGAKRAGDSSYFRTDGQTGAPFAPELAAEAEDGAAPGPRAVGQVDPHALAVAGHYSLATLRETTRAHLEGWEQVRVLVEKRDQERDELRAFAAELAAERTARELENRWDPEDWVELGKGLLPQLPIIAKVLAPFAQPAGEGLRAFLALRAKVRGMERAARAAKTLSKAGIDPKPYLDEIFGK